MAEEGWGEKEIFTKEEGEGGGVKVILATR